MDNNMISICITAYNVEKYIQQCLDSIVQFEIGVNKEIILVNDASIDTTDSIIQKWLSDHLLENIVYIQNKNNLGQVGSLIKAVDVSNGKYLSFFDADDFLIQSTLSYKMDLFQGNQNLKVVYGNGVFYEAGRFYGNIHANIIPILNKGINTTKNYINSHTPMLSLSTMVIKRDFFFEIGGFDNDGKSNDWVTNIKIFNTLAHRDEFCIDQTKAFAYRMHNNNISKNPIFQLELLLHVIYNHCNPLFLKSNLSNAYYITALRYLLIRKYILGFQYMNKSIKEKKSISKLFIFTFLLIMPKYLLAKYYAQASLLKQYILKYV